MNDEYTREEEDLEMGLPPLCCRPPLLTISLVKRMATKKTFATCLLFIWFKVLSLWMRVIGGWVTMDSTVACCRRVSSEWNWVTHTHNNLPCSTYDDGSKVCCSLLVDGSLSSSSLTMSQSTLGTGELESKECIDLCCNPFFLAFGWTVGVL